MTTHGRARARASVLVVTTVFAGTIVACSKPAPPPVVEAPSAGAPPAAAAPTVAEPDRTADAVVGNWQVDWPRMISEGSDLVGESDVINRFHTEFNQVLYRFDDSGTYKAELVLMDGRMAVREGMWSSREGSGENELIVTLEHIGESQDYRVEVDNGLVMYGPGGPGRGEPSRVPLTSYSDAEGPTLRESTRDCSVAPTDYHVSPTADRRYLFGQRDLPPLLVIDALDGDSFRVEALQDFGPDTIARP
jgi:hypothetical protein